LKVKLPFAVHFPSVFSRLSGWRLSTAGRRVACHDHDAWPAVDNLHHHPLCRHDGVSVSFI
jgi:hypothetical protein